MPDLAFLTGATGFVGANLARLLLEKGLRVRALARPGSRRVGRLHPSGGSFGGSRSQNDCSPDPMLPR